MTDNAESDNLPKDTTPNEAKSQDNPARRTTPKASPKPNRADTSLTVGATKPSAARKGKKKGHVKVPEPTLVVEGIRHSVKLTKSRRKVDSGMTDIASKESSETAPNTTVARPDQPTQHPQISTGNGGTTLLAQLAVQASSQALPGAPLTLPLVTHPTIPQQDPPIPPPSPPQPPASPSSPGKRRGIPHTYTDYANEPDSPSIVRKRTGGVTKPFPEKLHEMLTAEAESRDVVGWLPHGRAFIVRKPHQFTGHIMTKYFRQTKLTSFQRQLNLYGFRRITQGPDAGAYYHELFLQGKPQLCMRMQRQKVKGTGHKLPSDVESEPNFYAMAPTTGQSPPEMESPGMQGLRGAANLLQGISAGLPPAALLSPRPAGQTSPTSYSTLSNTTTNPLHWQYTTSAVERHTSLVDQDNKPHASQSKHGGTERPLEDRNQSHGDNAADGSNL